MNGKKVSEIEIKRMTILRETGHSLPEIGMAIGRGKGTVHRYVKSIKVLPKYRETLRVKQGGSKVRAVKDWSKASNEAGKLILPFQSKDKLLVLSSLYWGEGTKRELNIVNSDPLLIRTFVNCLYELGVSKRQLRVTLRIYNGIDKDRSIRYWSKVLDISKDQVLNVNILHGKKEGKLEYGMCRVRVTKGARYFKLIISMIDLIKSELCR